MKRCIVELENLTLKEALKIIEIIIKDSEKIDEGNSSA